MKSCLRATLALAIVLSAAAIASAGGITQVIAYSGAVLPSGTGAYQAFARRTATGPSNLTFLPVINDAGQLAFAAQTTSVGGLPDGIFRADANHVEQIADKNLKVSSGRVQIPITFYYAPVSINATGQIGFRVGVQDPSPFASRVALYDGAAIRVVSQTGSTPALNDLGQLVTNADSGIVRADVANTVSIAKL